MPILDHSLWTIFPPPPPKKRKKKTPLNIVNPHPQKKKNKNKNKQKTPELWRHHFLRDRPQGRSPPERFWVNALVLCVGRLLMGWIYWVGVYVYVFAAPWRLKEFLQMSITEKMMHRRKRNLCACGSMDGMCATFLSKVFTFHFCER